MLEHSNGEERPLRKLTYEIVHVTERRQIEEQIDNKDLSVDYHEVKAINGNGQVKTEDGDGHR